MTSAMRGALGAICFGLAGGIVGVGLLAIDADAIRALTYLVLALSGLTIVVALFVLGAQLATTGSDPSPVE